MMCVACLERGSELAANKYCTLPRTNPDLRQRPFSTAGIHNTLSQYCRGLQRS